MGLQSLQNLNIFLGIYWDMVPGNYNQVVDLGPRSVPILFLATAAIDFDEPDRHPAAAREVRAQGPPMAASGGCHKGYVGNGRAASGLHSNAL